MTKSNAPETGAIRAGIVGTGFMGSVHATAIRAAGGIVLGAVSSGRRSSAEAAAAVGAEEGFDTVQSLLESEDIDVVHICTPNSTHETLAVQALQAGKKVVCEKPLATSEPAARRVLETGLAHDDEGAVPFVYRFHPLVREFRSRILRGDAGVVSVVHGSYLQDWLADSVEINWRVLPEAGGPSRAFADIGTHWFDLFEFVTGDRVLRLAALTRTALPSRGELGLDVQTEDAVGVLFTTQGGVVGTAVISQVAAGRKNRLHLEISGSDASFSFDQETPDRLWVGAVAQNTELLRGADTASSPARRLSTLPPGHPMGYQDAFIAFVRDTYAAFLRERPDGLPTFRDGHRAAQITKAVLESAATAGDWVDVPGPYDAQFSNTSETPQRINS